MALMIKEQINNENVSEYYKRQKEIKEAKNTLPDVPGAQAG